MTLTRRAALASFAATAFVGVPRARAGKTLYIGRGQHTYEVQHDWGETPRGFVYGITHGVAVDKQDNVYIAHTAHPDSDLRDCVLVFDPDGAPLRSWGAEYAGGVHGFDIFDEGEEEVVYLTDLTRGLFKLTLDGEVLWHVARPGFHDGKDLKYRPTNVGVAPDGTVYFADGYGSYYIHVFDHHGRELGTFGGPGDHQPGRTFHPHGIFIDTRRDEPLVVVCENYYGEGVVAHGQLQRFDLEGNFHSYVEMKDLRQPRHGDIHRGTLLIPDFFGRITLLDHNDRLITHLGDSFTTNDHLTALQRGPRQNYPAGKFVRPHDGAFTSRGDIIITEFLPTGRVTRLNQA
ncbi:MAG: NHL repeat-containing protein [Planctomycetota bacterium]|jgi:hypothetical protein